MGAVKLTDEQLRTGLALCEAATAGPWVHGSWIDPAFPHAAIRPRDATDISITTAADSPTESKEVIGGCGCCGSPSGSAEDAAFIASSRTLLPLALAEIVTLRARLVAVEGARDEACDQWADCVDEFITNGADCEGDRKAIARCRNAGKETSR